MCDFVCRVPVIASTSWTSLRAGLASGRSLVQVFDDGDVRFEEGRARGTEPGRGTALDMRAPGLLPSERRRSRAGLASGLSLVQVFEDGDVRFEEGGVSRTEPGRGTAPDMRAPGLLPSERRRSRAGLASPMLHCQCRVRWSFRGAQVNSSVAPIRHEFCPIRKSVFKKE